MTFRISSRTIFGAAALLSLGASLAVGAGHHENAFAATNSHLEGSAGRSRPRRHRDDLSHRHAAADDARVDTLRMTHTVYRVDTVTKYPAPMHIRGGFYVGLAGGVSAPAGALYTPNSAGPTGQLQLGWQGAKQVLGGRFDVNYVHPGQDSRFSHSRAMRRSGTGTSISKLQLPWFTHMMGGFGRFALYGIGGYSASRSGTSRCASTTTATTSCTANSTVNSVIVAINGNHCNNINGVSDQRHHVNNIGDIPAFVAGNDGWHYESGWNAGGGASLTWSRTELFVESRVIGFNVEQRAAGAPDPDRLRFQLY